MATSLSKLKNQIKKLQKQVVSIQSTVITRIKREIAQHGLSVEDLFGTEGAVASAGTGRPAQQKKTAGAKKSGANKPAKFADDQGNTWHGIGKRPQWIHEVLAAGRKLEEFLVGAKKDSAAAPKRAAKKTRVKAAAKTPAKKTAAVKKKAPAGKKAASKTAAKKAPAKRAAKARAESTASAPAEAS